MLMSVSRETTACSHIDELMGQGVPLVFFDRVMDQVETTKIVTNDYESAYLATEHLIKNGCSKILFLSFSNILSISNRRLHGYKNALLQHKLEVSNKNIILFNNELKKRLPAYKEKTKFPQKAGRCFIIRRQTNHACLPGL